MTQEEFDNMLTSPLPGRATTQPTQAELDADAQSFMDFNNIFGGGE